jgi:hypothetical protein
MRRIAFVSVFVAGCVLAASLFGGAGFCAQVNRGMGVPVEDLPDALKGLEIRDYVVPSPFKRVGVIHALNGHVVVIHRADNRAYFGVAGDPVHENDSFQTLGDGRCRIKFVNEDVVTMAANTSFAVERFSDQKALGQKSSLFSMIQGKAMFYALRLFGYKKVQFKLKTPTAVVGIRGTKFGAHVYWVEGEKTTRNGVRVASRGDETGLILTQLDPGGGGQSFTDCFSEDGALDVNGRVINPGEMFRGETGQVIPTPPQVIRAFESETEVKGEDQKAGEEETGKEEKKEEQKEGDQEETAEGDEKGGEEEATEETAAVIETGGERDLGAGMDIRESLTETVHQEVSTSTETETGGADATLIAEGKTAEQKSGTAMLLVDPTGKAFYNASPIKTPLYNTDDNYLVEGAAMHVSYEDAHFDNPNYKMTIQEVSASNMDMNITEFGWGTPATPANHTFKWHFGGGYKDENGHEYMFWGWWSDASGADVGKIGSEGANEYYAAAETIWEVEGETTHPDYIDYLHQQGQVFTYSGESKGVYASSAAPDVRVLSGDFSCKIDFGNYQVSNFSINASQGGVGPTVVDMHGGSGTLKTAGDFDISNFSGTVGGGAIDPSYTGAGGGCVGGKAQGVGGNWWARGGTDHWATGEFHGKR